MEATVRRLAFASGPSSLLRLRRRPSLAPHLSLPRGANPNLRNGVPFCSRPIPLSISSSRHFSSPPSNPKASFPPSGLVINGLDGGSLGFRGELGEAWMVVLLGWLGAEPKHMKRYAELYRERGIMALSFVVPVWEVLGFDLGRRVEGRVGRLAREVVDWCSEMEKSGKEPRLLFHTFSNTGWIVYGSILENLQSRNDITQKIKGCVIDSGGAPEIDPQVWAAGFSAALLKKHSSSAKSLSETIEGRQDGSTNKLSMQDNGSHMIEILLLAILAKFFTICVNLPYINQRLTKIISILSKNQPFCPQLYLYSSSDKVIPVCSIERFIEEQKALGRVVYAHDFISSPHVDHFRGFPLVYSTKVHEFVNQCCFEKTYHTKTG